MKSVILLLLILLNVMYLSSQENTITDEFKPSGKPFVKVFSNYHGGLKDNISAFEITRAYLGYQYNMSEEFSGNVTFDVGNPGSGSLEQTAYLKLADLTYNKGIFASHVGLIPTINFGEQQKYWGHRYIWKSFQDMHGMATSADLGASLQVKPNEMITFEIAIHNGEGYKKIQSDNNHKASAALTLTPAKGLSIRGVYDRIESSEAQQTIATFIGYNYKDKVVSGIEYNMQTNYKYKDGYDYSGFSVYSSYNINKTYQLFGRYDQISSVTLPNTTDSWRIASDGSFLVGGIQASPIKNIKVALNYQLYEPSQEDVSKTDFIFFNIEFAY